MTREEAIAYWKQRSEHIHNWLEENEDVDFIGEYVEAIDTAIEALSEDTIPIEKYHELQHQFVMLGATFADLTEVVRCKDCRHRDLFSCPLADNDFQKDEDFCSWGERQET